MVLNGGDTTPPPWGHFGLSGGGDRFEGGGELFQTRRLKIIQFINI